MGEISSKQAQRAGRILNAASDLFARYGFDKTTMDDIAQAAHVSKGAIYLHFRSKEDLFDALILRENDQLELELMRRLEADGDRMTVFSLYRHSVEATLARPLMRALMTSDHRVLGDFMHRIKDTPAYHNATSIGIEWVRQLQQAGLIRADVAPESLSAVLMLVKYGYLCLLDLIDDPPPPEVTGEIIADMLQRAFGTDYGDSEAGRAVMRQLFERGREFLKAIRAQQEAADQQLSTKAD